MSFKLLLMAELMVEVYRACRCSQSITQRTVMQACAPLPPVCHLDLPHSWVAWRLTCLISTSARHNALVSVPSRQTYNSKIKSFSLLMFLFQIFWPREICTNRSDVDCQFSVKFCENVNIVKFCVYKIIIICYLFFEDHLISNSISTFKHHLVLSSRSNSRK